MRKQNKINKGRGRLEENICTEMLKKIKTELLKEKQEEAKWKTKKYLRKKHGIFFFYWVIGLHMRKWYINRRWN